jgi:hypothetical protein
MNPVELWSFLPVGYLLTVLIELPIVLVGLSSRHSLRDRLLAGFWLTACTYPIVVLVLPLALRPHYSELTYLVVAETFAPLAECGLFWLAYINRLDHDARATGRDFAAIILANLASFSLGELVYAWAERSN